MTRRRVRLVISWVGFSCFVSLFGPDWRALAEGASSKDSLTRAIQLISEGKYQTAREVLETRLKASNEFDAAPIYYHLAICYAKQTEWKKAEDALNNYLKLYPQNLPAIYLKAYVLFRASRYQESLALVAAYLDKNPESGEAHKLLGINQFMLGSAEIAEVSLKRATELAPQDWEAWYFLGRIYFTRNDLLSALSMFKKVIELDPQSVKAHNHLGQTYEGLVQYPAAREAYLKAIALERQQTTKSEWPYFNLGVLYIKEGRAQESIEYLRQALARNPNWSEGKTKLGLALLSTGKYEDALTELNEAIRVDPQNAEACYQLARLLTKMKREEEAQQQYLIFEKLRQP
jgi:tetratricopeptide (TPR) repeat protein